MHIMIVDDSKAMRLIVRRTLREAGFGDHETTEGVDGADALEKIKAKCPDLVLSDWNMPNMTGIELLKSLNAEGIKVQFGFVTSEGTPEMRTTAAENGALFLIAKPFNADTFKEKIGEVLAGC